MNNEKAVLTGKTRHRLQIGGWFKPTALILQVEVKITGTVMSNFGSHIECDDYTRYIWRDAKVSDLTLEQISSVEIPDAST